MASEKYGQLIDKLLTKTEAGELKWEEAAEPGAFQVSLPNYSIMIAKSQEEHSMTVSDEDFLREWVDICTVNILNSQGRTIDSFTQDDSGHPAKLFDLYEKVRRQALRVDKALDEILSELDDAR